MYYTEAIEKCKTVLNSKSIWIEKKNGEITLDFSVYKDIGGPDQLAVSTSTVVSSTVTGFLPSGPGSCFFIFSFSILIRASLMEALI